MPVLILEFYADGGGEFMVDVADFHGIEGGIFEEPAVLACQAADVGEVGEEDSAAEADAAADVMGGASVDFVFEGGAAVRVAQTNEEVFGDGQFAADTNGVAGAVFEFDIVVLFGIVIAVEYVLGRGESSHGIVRELIFGADEGAFGDEETQTSHHAERSGEFVFGEVFVLFVKIIAVEIGLDLAGVVLLQVAVIGGGVDGHADAHEVNGLVNEAEFGVDTGAGSAQCFVGGPLVEAANRVVFVHFAVFRFRFVIEEGHAQGQTEVELVVVVRTEGEVHLVDAASGLGVAVLAHIVVADEILVLVIGTCHSVHQPGAPGQFAVVGQGVVMDPVGGVYEAVNHGGAAAHTGGIDEVVEIVDAVVAEAELHHAPLALLFGFAPFERPRENRAEVSKTVSYAIGVHGLAVVNSVCADGVDDDRGE